MINVVDLRISIGERVLLSKAAFRIDKGERIGLVGRNGAGKTTLTRLLADQLGDEDVIDCSGTISRTGTIGYLPQNSDQHDRDQLARDRIVSVRGLDQILSRIEKAEKEMSSETGQRQQKAMERYVRLDQEFTMNGGWAARSEAMAIGANLNLDETILAKPLGDLSGGQRRRVELARVLFSNAQVLLLDEPTNHLDHDSIIWLRDYLRSFSGGFLVISHDEKLLDETVNQVFYLDASRGELDAYNLGWKAYLEARRVDEIRRKRERQNAEKKAATLRLQGEKLRAKATKAVAAQQMLRRAENLLDNLSENKKEEKVAKIRFPKPQDCGKIILEAKGISKNYGSLEIFSNLDITVERAMRIVILGENGAGKTTLLRTLSGVEALSSGEIVPGHGLKMGYFAQEHEILDQSITVLENLQKVADNLDVTQVRSLLGQFLFSGDDVFKPTKVLSGGERTRLALATLVTSRANLLLLDEPTNNLDPASRQEILQALKNYEGAVLLVTHDAGAIKALDPQKVLFLPEAQEDWWSEEYLELVELD